MKERLASVLTSLTAKYVAVFVLLVAVPAVAVGVYTLSSSYNREKADLIRLQQEKAKSVAEAIDRTLTGIADRLGAIHLAGLSQSQGDLVLRPLGLADPNINYVAYVDRHGRLRTMGWTSLVPGIQDREKGGGVLRLAALRHADGLLHDRRRGRELRQRGRH